MIHKEASFINVVHDVFKDCGQQTLTNEEIRKLLLLPDSSTTRVSMALLGLRKANVIRALGKRSKSVVYELTGEDNRHIRILEHKPANLSNRIIKSQKGRKIDPSSPMIRFKNPKRKSQAKKPLQFKEKVRFADIYGICPHCQGHFAFSFNKA